MITLIYEIKRLFTAIAQKIADVQHLPWSLPDADTFQCWTSNSNRHMQLYWRGRIFNLNAYYKEDERTVIEAHPYFMGLVFPKPSQVPEGFLRLDNVINVTDLPGPWWDDLETELSELLQLLYNEETRWTLTHKEDQFHRTTKALALYKQLSKPEKKVVDKV